MYLNNINNDLAPPHCLHVSPLYCHLHLSVLTNLFSSVPWELLELGCRLKLLVRAVLNIVYVSCSVKRSQAVMWLLHWIVLIKTGKYAFKIICTSHTLQKRKPVKFRPCGTINIIELCLIMSIDYMQFNCKTHYEIGKLYCITMKWPVNWKKKEILRVMSNKISSIQIVYVKNIENSKNRGLYM